MATTGKSPRTQTGFGLADALVGLLLLAGATVLLAQVQRQSLHLLHDAGLRLQAVDLAADLGESLQAAADAPEGEALLARWQARVPATLPRSAALHASLSAGGAAPAASGPAWQNVSLRWQVAGDRTESFSLPLAGALPR